MRLERVGAAVIVAPLGSLDGSGIGRLRDIVRSRERDLELLVLDLRDLASVDAAGVAFLAEASARAREQRRRLAIVAGPVARRAVAATGDAAGLPLVDDAEELLAPYRERRRAGRQTAPPSRCSTGPSG